MDPTRAERILVVLIVLTAVFTAGAYHHARVSDLEAQVADLEDRPATVGAFASNEIRVPVPAVAADGKGLIVTATVADTPGNGTYIDVDNATIAAETQTSVVNARAALRRSPGASDPGGIAVDFHTPPTWRTVDGRSAGLSLAVALAVLTTGAHPREGVAMTGEVNADGTIDEVAHVRAKARAAREAGYDVMVVPEGQAQNVPGIEFVEVGTVEEALEVILQDV